MPAIRNTTQTKSKDTRKSLVTLKRRPRRPIPRAERVAKKAVKDERVAAIQEKIRQLWRIIVEFAEEEAPKVNATVDEIVSGLLSLGRRKTQTRRPNAWNAFQHIQALKRKAALASREKSEEEENRAEPSSSEDTQKASEGPENDAPPHNLEDHFLEENSVPENMLDGSTSNDPEDAGGWTDGEENAPLTLQEAVQESKRAYNEAGVRVPEEAEALRKKLEAHRVEKAGVVKRQFLAHKADVRKTLDRIDKDVTNLGHRCDIETLCISVRTKLEHQVAPRIIATKGAKEYFQKVFRQEPVKFAFQMENYFTNGLYGNLARNANQRQTNLKAEIRKLLTEGLATVTGHDHIQFPWTDFFTRATEGFMVELRGWPLRYFNNPSNFKTKDDLEAVRNALLTGRCHFAKISQERLDELKIKHARAKEQGRSGEVSVLQEDDAPSVVDGAHVGGARSSTAVSADPGPPQPPFQPVATYQDVFQVNFSAASDLSTVPPDLTSSIYAAPHFPAMMPTADLYYLPAISAGAPEMSSHPTSEVAVSLAAEPTSAVPGQGQKRRRWDAGLDRNVVQEVKRLAGEGEMTPAEYLASHPEMYEKARKNKHEKSASRRRARVAGVATGGSQA